MLCCSASEWFAFASSTPGGGPIRPARAQPPGRGGSAPYSREASVRDTGHGARSARPSRRQPSSATAAAGTINALVLFTRIGRSRWCEAGVADVVGARRLVPQGDHAPHTPACVHRSKFDPVKRTPDRARFGGNCRPNAVGLRLPGSLKPRSGLWPRGLSATIVSI